MVIGMIYFDGKGGKVKGYGHGEVGEGKKCDF